MMWMNVWTLLLIAVLVTYGAVTIYVTVGGVRDIRSMLKQLKEEDETAGKSG